MGVFFVFCCLFYLDEANGLPLVKHNIQLTLGAMLLVGVECDLPCSRGYLG